MAEIGMWSVLFIELMAFGLGLGYGFVGGLVYARYKEIKRSLDE